MKPILAAILSVSGEVLTDEEKYFLEKVNPLGVALFGRNLKTKEQVKTLTQSIKESIGRDDVLIALDEEGGRVNRLLGAGFSKYASQTLLSKIGEDDIVKTHAELISEDMIAVGANLNFAPVLDLDYENTTTALKSRTFLGTPEVVSKYGRILWQTYQKNGICPCMKHLPGHGRAESDPHLGLPVIDCMLCNYEKDLMPFILNKDCPAAMTAHILMPEVDDKLPITMSEKGIKRVIRGLIGYQGFLISDALEMKALAGRLTEKVCTSLDAGLDAVCYCMGDMKGLQEIAQTKRYLTDMALERFEKIRKILKTHSVQRNVDFLKQTYYAKVNLFDEERVNYDATEVLFQLRKG